MPDFTLLSVENLCIGTSGKSADKFEIENINFRLNPGQVLGITGRSGAGKTLTAMALAGILPRPLAVLGGRIRFMGEPVWPGTGGGRFQGLGRDVLMLFQSPSQAFDPWVKIGVHLTDAIKAAAKVRESTPKALAIHALETVGLGAWAFGRYPFELSGGQRQRCLMALALAVRPRILIADEPATGQDDLNRALVERCIQDLTRDLDCAVIVISHDLRSVLRIARELVVIYNGRQIEAGPVRRIVANPCHDHTRELVNAMKFLAHHSI